MHYYPITHNRNSYLFQLNHDNDDIIINSSIIKILGSEKCELIIIVYYYY